MARIYLDARAASTVTSGVGRYAHALARELRQRAPHHDVVIIRSARYPQAPEAGQPPSVEVAWPTGSIGLASSTRAIRRLLQRIGRPDIYHALFHVVPYGIREGQDAPGRVIVTLHDLIWIDHANLVHDSSVRAAWRKTVGNLLIPYALRSADHVICNSAFTAQGAARWVSPDHTTVVHMGVSNALLAAPTYASGVEVSSRAPYFTAFGIPKPYKNIKGLLAALAVLRRTHPAVTLTLFGGDGGASDAIAQLGLHDAVHVFRNATDDEVRRSMRGAIAHVVPSLVEGFGLPVLEAMALGTPVITSEAAALREVAADAALCADATDPGTLACAMTRLLVDADLRGELRTRGLARAQQFTWSRTAEATLAVYQRALDEPRACGQGDAPSMSLVRTS